MSLKQINEHLWLQELDLGIFDVRGALVIGEERAVIWDTLSHPRDMEPYLPLIGSKELFVVYSHADWDHIWGSAILPATTFFGHKACRARFQADVPKTLREKRLAEPGRWDEVQLVPPAIVFQESLLIDLGGLTLDLHHLPGHTADCLVALIPEQGILLTGDTTETPFPIVPADSPLAVWISRLRQWQQDERVERVIPSHGPLGGRELIAQSVDYLVHLQKGETFDLPEAVPPFYQEMHQANLRWSQS